MERNRSPTVSDASKPPDQWEIEERLAGTEALISAVRDGSMLVGELPPRPPTLRGRVGALLVVVVRRAAFWLISQIRDFQIAVARNQKDHSDLLRDLTAHLMSGQDRTSRDREMQDRATQDRATRDRAWQDRLDSLSEAQSLQGVELASFRAALSRQQEIVRERDLLQQDLSLASFRVDELTRVQKDQFAEFAAQIRQIAAKAERLAGQESLERLGQDIENFRKELNAVSAMAGNAIAQVEGLTKMMSALSARLTNDFRAADRYSHQTRLQLALQERRLSILFGEVRRRGGGDSAGLVKGCDEAASPNIVDPLYLEFENLFRGDRADIKQRFAVYLPRLKDLKLGNIGMSVLDLGCGRGEWLELLHDEDLVGTGVDANATMIDECRSRGLSVVQGDAISHLRSLLAGSLGVVTGFHIVEHLPLSDLLALLDETARVLRPGGLAIFETPNPSNLQVSTQSFYLDPTHRNPLPSALLKFLLEARGLCDVEVLPLHPYPASFRLPEDGQAATRLLNHLMFSEQDYAVIGRKA